MASQQGTLGKFHTLNQHPEARGLCDRVLATMPGSLVILNASSVKPSIVYCNPAFERITAYASAEVIGRDCCFLQGIDTDPVAIEQIRHALQVAQECLKPQKGKPGILIIKEYGNLPKVEYYAGQINQVFMNLLSNAIDALEAEIARGSWVMSHREESSDRQLAIANSPLPTIRICTTANNKNQVIIRIADNGCGIPEAVQKPIFDPFFTTKPVGEGTGLGLSISYQVVERHGGQFKCLSTPGQGTECVLEIPLQQSTASATPLPMASSQVA